MSTFEERIEQAVREAHRVAEDRAARAPRAADLVGDLLSIAAQSSDGNLWLSSGIVGPPLWTWTLLWEGLEPRRSMTIRVGAVSGSVSWSYSASEAAPDGESSGSIPIESFQEDSLLEAILGLIDQRRWAG